MRYLISAAAAMAVLATSSACCWDGGWQASESVDVGVSADLEAVVPLADPQFGYLAVGSGGTVVAWDYADEVNAKVWTMAGEVSLNGVVSLGHGEDSEWWVIGEGGFVAVTEDRGETWSTIDLLTTADLHAIVAIDDRLVVVGDAVVRVREPDGIWIEPPAPVGGWGQLRDVAHEAGWGTPVWAVGMGGIIWTAEDPSGAWVAEDSGTTADLFAAGIFQEEGLLAASGASGTVVVRDVEASEWRSLDSGIEADIIHYHDDYFLTADGQLLEARYRRDVWGLEHVETFPGARAFIHEIWESDKVVVVGDAGSVSKKWNSWGGGPFCKL
jgi:hypothetical protein